MHADAVRLAYKHRAPIHATRRLKMNQIDEINMYG